VPSTCFEHPCVHSLEDLFMQFYGIFSCIRINSLVDVRMFHTEERRRQYNLIKSLKKKCVFCWFLLHMCITMRGSENVKFTTEKIVYNILGE